MPPPLNTSIYTYTYIWPGKNSTWEKVNHCVHSLLRVPAGPTIKLMCWTPLWLIMTTWRVHMYSNTGARNLMLLLFQFHYTSMLCTQGPAIHNTYHKAFCVLHSECSRELTIKPSLMTPNTLMCITWGDGGTPLITHTHTHTHTHVHRRFTVRPQSGFTQHRSQEI